MNGKDNDSRVQLTVKEPPLKRLKGHLEAMTQSAANPDRPKQLHANNLSPNTLRQQLKEDEKLLLSIFKDSHTVSHIDSHPYFRPID